MMQHIINLGSASHLGAGSTRLGCTSAILCSHAHQAEATAVLQGSPEGTIQVQVTLLAKEALGQPELAATSDARLQAAFGQAGKGDIIKTGVAMHELAPVQKQHACNMAFDAQSGLASAHCGKALDFCTI